MMVWIMDCLTDRPAIIKCVIQMIPLFKLFNYLNGRCSDPQCIQLSDVSSNENLLSWVALTNWLCLWHSDSWSPYIRSPTNTTEDQPYEGSSVWGPTWSGIKCKGTNRVVYLCVIFYRMQRFWALLLVAFLFILIGSILPLKYQPQMTNSYFLNACMTSFR